MTRSKLRTYITTLAIIMAISLSFGILGFIPKASALPPIADGLNNTSQTVTYDFAAKKKTVGTTITTFSSVSANSNTPTNIFNGLRILSKGNSVGWDTKNGLKMGSSSNYGVIQFYVSSSCYLDFSMKANQNSTLVLAKDTATDLDLSSSNYNSALESLFSYDVSKSSSYSFLHTDNGYKVALEAGIYRLYAPKQWTLTTLKFTPANTNVWSVSFDTNGGNNLEREIVEKNNSIKLPTPTKNGFNFLGWYEKADFSGSAVSSPYTPSKDCTLYAKWEELAHWTVTIDNLNGTTESFTVNKGEKITLPNSSPILLDSVFLGWCTKKDASDNIYQPSQEFSPTADTTLYAVWSSEIELNIQGANSDEVTIGNFPTNAIHGAKVTLPTLTVLNNDLTFSGYSISDSENNSITVTDNCFTMPNGSVMVTATFKQADQYTVIFMDGNKVYTTISAKQNSLIERPIDPTNSDALRFGGWYTDTSKSSKCNKFDFTFDKITKDITLYALWINPVDTQSFMKYIDSLIDGTYKDYKKPVWSAEGPKYQWNYIDGVILNGIVNLYYSTNNEKYKDFFLWYVSYYVNDNGEFLNVKDSKNAKVVSLKELDFICESKILFDAYELSHNEKYIKAIENTYKNLTSMGIVDGTNGNYEHKGKYAQQVWLDGMYMYAPFNARYLASKKQYDKLHDLRLQFQFIHDKMKAPNGLYYHAYSPNTSLCWVDPKTYCSHNFWSRSVGWLTMSLADVIEYFPEGEDRQFLTQMFNDLIDALLIFKDKDTDMFYQILDGDSSLTATKNDKTLRNYLEASGSSMVAYALQKGSRLGYLKSDTIDYKKEGRETFEGIYNHSLDTSKNILYDICVQAGLDASGNRDGSIYYYLSEAVNSGNEAKGTGPFILAFIEYTYADPTAPLTPDIRQKTATFSVDGNVAMVTPINFYTGKTISKPSNPSVSGKTFKHWSLYPSGIEFDFNTPLCDNTTLYAVWQNDTIIELYCNYNIGDTLKSADSISGNSKLAEQGYAFIGWTIDFSAIYEAGTTAPVDGAYTAVYAKVEFLGGSIRKTDPTGVRFGFCLYFYGITDEATIKKLGSKVSAEFNVIVNGNDNKIKAKNYKYDNETGGMIMNVVITNNIDATKSDSDLAICELKLETSITVKLKGSSTTLIATGIRSIQEIATKAFENNDIDLAMAKKYGYKETINK